MHKTINLIEYLTGDPTEDAKSEKNAKKDFSPIRFKKQEKVDGTVQFSFDFESHTCFEDFIEILARSTGLHDRSFALTLLNQVLDATASRKQDKPVDKSNSITAALLDVKPRNSLEGMLLSQMIAVHHQAMDNLKRSNEEGQYAKYVDRYQNQAVKLMRLFANQLETLEKYRRGGKSTLVIERKGHE